MKTTLHKSDPFSPAFSVNIGLNEIELSDGAEVTSHGRSIALPKKLTPGSDYAIQPGLNALKAVKLLDKPKADALGGFHVGLDGNIAEHSIWDAKFLPGCRDPRGMGLVDGKWWGDYYKLNSDPHLYGTSSAGKQICDGKSPPMLPDGKRATNFNWFTATALFAHYGKQLLSREEFTIAMEGVEENLVFGKDPVITGHAPGLKSKWGFEQATGCMWDWSRDINLEGPWIWVMGGSWDSSDAGPRQFNDVDPDYGWNFFGARGRCDHLILE